MTKEEKGNTMWPIMAGFAVILAIVLGVLQFDSYMDRKIENAMRNPKFIEEIACQVRPAIIFDSKGSIIADLGGMKFIRQIKVESKKQPIPDRIIVTRKEFMASPPMLSPIDRIECIFKTRQDFWKTT